MEDLVTELRHLDPSRLISMFHYNEDMRAGQRIQVDYWNEARMIPTEELPAAWADCPTETVVVEIKCPSDTFWLVIPVSFPNTRFIKKIHTSVVVDKDDAWLHFGVRGEILPANAKLLPPGVVGIMGDFYAKA